MARGVDELDSALLAPPPSVLAAAPEAGRVASGKQRGSDEDERSFAHIQQAPALQPGTELPKPQGVFPRIQLEEHEGS